MLTTRSVIAATANHYMETLAFHAISGRDMIERFGYRNAEIVSRKSQIQAPFSKLLAMINC
jgi:hypothetical protein